MGNAYDNTIPHTYEHCNRLVYSLLSSACYLYTEAVEDKYGKSKWEFAIHLLTLYISILILSKTVEPPYRRALSLRYVIVPLIDWPSKNACIFLRNHQILGREVWHECKRQANCCNRDMAKLFQSIFV